MEDVLIELGITDEAAGIYVSCLKLGETTVARIAEKSNIKRTTVYGHLKELRRHGLIQTSVRRSRMYVIASHPNTLKEMVKQHQSRIDEMVPKLIALMSVVDKPPVVKYFEGNDGIEDAFRDVLNYENSEVLEWISETDLEYTNNRFWHTYFIPERLKKKIFLRAIVGPGKESELFKNAEKQTLRQVRVDTDNLVKIDSIILLYGGSKVAFISYREMAATVIESRNFFNTQKSLFNLHWGSLKD